MTRRVGVAVNPTAHAGRAAAVGGHVLHHVRTAGHEVVDLSAASAPAFAAAARSALADGLEALVVVGGDGTVGTAVDVVAGTGTPLGIVAAGTGNDVARALGLPVGDPHSGVTRVVDALAARSVRHVDAVRCTSDAGTGGAGPQDAGTGGARTRWYAGVLGAGFDAVVNERANSWSWPRGRLRYPLAAARELPVLRPRPYTLTLDGRTVTTPAVLVAVANGPSYGGGMRVVPSASMTDGLLDVLVVGPLSRTAFLRIFPAVYAGRHVGHPAVTITRAASVRVEAPDVVGYADGERVGPLPLHCEAVPGALALLGVAPAG